MAVPRCATLAYYLQVAPADLQHALAHELFPADLLGANGVGTPWLGAI